MPTNRRVAFPEGGHMSNPLISIIVPVYNVEKYLPKCVESLLAQTYSNLEIILVDDGSVDASGQICDTYAAKDSRVRVIHQPNAGVSAARNAGLKAARGEYIGFVDADDWVEPDMYEYLYGLISKENAHLAMCNFYTFTDSDCKPVIQISADYAMYPLTSIFDFPSWIYLWNKLFKKSTLGDQLFNSQVSYGEDSSFIFECIKKQGLLSVGNQPKYYYRHNPKSASNSFKKSHLSLLENRKQEMEYARQHQWTNFCTTKKGAELNSVTCWLGMLSSQEYPDMESVRYLISYLRSHLWIYLRLRNIALRNKLFAILCCVDFKTAGLLYKLFKGKRKK